MYNGFDMVRHPALMSLIVSFALLAGAAAQEDEFYPHTRERGRAAVEYDDDEIHVVAAYYYSQRQHDSPWLLIEAAVSTERVMDIHRDEIRLVMQTGGSSRSPHSGVSLGTSGKHVCCSRTPRSLGMGSGRTSSATRAH